MTTPRPCCVLLWLARTGSSQEQNAACDSLHADVRPPDDRSMSIRGEEDELVSVDEKIDGLPLSDRYAAAAIAAARKKGLDRVTFAAAIFFRDGREAPKTSRSLPPLCFVGRFDFPFPERGDHIPRDEHGWLGIDEAYCLDEPKASDDDDDGYIGHF